MNNPYRNRKMIRDPRYFFGRKKEIEKIFKAIETPHPQNISILGERKIGKSSLLYYILQSNTDRQKLTHPERYIFAFLDFQRVLGITVEEFWKMLYSELKDKLPSEIEIMEVKDFKTFTNMVKTLDDHGYKLILLFDEFDEILRNRNFGEDFFSNLRSQTNRYDIAYILSTQRNLEDLSRRDLLGSPFFNIFVSIRLGLFQKDEALDLINRPSAEEGIPLEEDKEFILSNAGLFPFFIQILCSKLFEYKKKHGKIDHKGHLQVLEEFREETTPHLDHFWKNFSQEEKEVLVGVAMGKEVKTEKKHIAESLRRKGYIETVNEKNQIFSNIFQQFVLEYRKEIIKVDESQITKQKLFKTFSRCNRVLKWISTILSIILLTVVSNWVYERFSSGEDSSFIKTIGRILTVFSPIANQSFFLVIAFLLITTIILYYLSKR